MSLTSSDLQTLLEFIQKKDKEVLSEVKSDLTDSMLVLEERICSSVSESIHESILDSIKGNTDYRGPMGYSGKDGDSGKPGLIGEQGPRGPQGPVPGVDVDLLNSRIRFQTGISESTGFAKFTDWIDTKGSKGDALTWHDLTEAQKQMLVGPKGEQGPKGSDVSAEEVASILKSDNNFVESFKNNFSNNTEVPTTPKGNPNDLAGSVAFDDDNMYFCEKNYDGVNNIWRKIPCISNW